MCFEKIHSGKCDSENRVRENVWEGRGVASDWSMMWDFWMITRKVRVVFPLGNFGVTAGFQIVYREYSNHFPNLSYGLMDCTFN